MRAQHTSQSSRAIYHDHGLKTTAMACYSALTHIRHRTRRIPGEPGGFRGRVLDEAVIYASYLADDHVDQARRAGVVVGLTAPREANDRE